MFLFLLIGCKDGDVSFYDNIPKLFWSGNFISICGNGFWNNNHGSTLFCQKLGYTSGNTKRSEGQSTSSMKALFVGECKVTDTNLASCSGGHNVRTITSLKDCSNGYTYEIKCDGGNGSDDLEVSCDEWVKEGYFRLHRSCLIGCKLY